MKVRVTQTDVAQAAGVHNTTVSLSLRNSRLIPDATRKRIQAIAEEMGYCRDPALTALVAYRNSRRSKRQADTLAYITHWDTKWGWRDQPSHEQYYLGAQKGAAESGYNLEHFWLGEEGMTQRRLSDMLLNRGISGVLLASHQTMCDDLTGIDWSRLSAVKVGCRPHFPKLHQVIVDQSSVVSLAVRHILRAGHRRIGFVVPQGWDSFADQAWSRAFFAEQYLLPVKERLPILYLHGAQQDLSPNITRPAHPEDTRALSRWYREYRPEVIVGLGSVVLSHIKSIGLTVPRNVSYVDLALEGTLDSTGVRHNCERVGELAVELLAAQLRQNIFGLPAVPTVTSVCGEWVDGVSLSTIATGALGEMEPITPNRLSNALAV